MNKSIIETAKEIRFHSKNDTLNDSQYEEFKNKYPKFYIMLQHKHMDEEMYNKLLSTLSKNSANDQKAASEFSQYGAEKYLYPKFGRPTQSDLKTAQSKIDKLR